MGKKSIFRETYEQKLANAAARRSNIDQSVANVAENSLFGTTGTENVYGTQAKSVGEPIAAFNQPSVSPNGTLNPFAPTINLNNAVPFFTSAGRSMGDTQYFPDVNDISQYTKYGVQITRDRTYDLDRALAQSRTEQFFNALKQAGTVIGGETISGAGSIGAIFGSIFDEVKGGNAEFNNAMMDWGEQLQAYGRAKAPIYRENPNKSWDVGDFAWWASNAPSVASSLGLLIPGIGAGYGASKITGWIGKLGKMASMADKVGDASKLSRALYKTVAPLAKLGEGSKYYSRLVTSAFVMRNGENLKESMMVYNDANNEALGMLGNMSPNEFEQWKVDNQSLVTDFQQSTPGQAVDPVNLSQFIASKAGWRNYAVDAGNVVFDMIQLAPILRGFKPSTRTTLNPSKLLNAEAKLAGREAMSKSRSFLNDMLYYGVGTTGFEAVTEGIEEAVNYIASNEGMSYAKALLGDKDQGDFASRMSEYTKDPALWEQAFWGSMGGMVFSGASRGLRTIHNAITDKYDTGAVKHRIEEGKGRTATIMDLVRRVNAINEGYEITNLEGLDERVPIETPEQANRVKQQLIAETGLSVGLNAAKFHNSNLLISQLNSPEFKGTIEALADNKDEVNSILNTLKEQAVKAEKLYDSYYSNIIVKDIPEHLKGILINKGIMLDSELDGYKKSRNEVQQRITEKTSSNIYNVIQNAINKELENTTGNYTNSLELAGLQRLISDIRQVITSAKKKNNKAVETRFSGILDKALDRREALKREGNIGYNKLLEKGVEESLLADLSTKIGFDYLIDDTTGTLSNLLTNTDAVAEDYNKQIETAKKKMLDAQDTMINTALSKASTVEEVDKLLNTINLLSDEYNAYPALKKKYEAQIKKIKAKRKLIADDIAKREAAQTPPVAPETTPVTVTPEELPEEPAEPEVPIGSPVPPVSPAPPEPEAPTPPPAAPTTTASDEESTNNGTDQTPGEYTEETPEVTTTPEVPTPTPETPTTVESQPPTPPIQPPTIQDDATDIITNYNPNTSDLVLFISSLYNMKDMNILGDDNIVWLSDDDAAIANIIYNQLKEGDQLFIKYSDNDATKGTLGRAVGLYDASGNLLFHLQEQAESTSGTIFSMHDGLVYTAEGSWISYLIARLKEGNNDYMSLVDKLIEYNRLRVNRLDNKDVYSELIAKPELLDLINYNRDSKIDVKSDEFAKALNHLAAVLTYKYDYTKPFMFSEAFVTNILSWEKRITDDLYYGVIIRRNLAAVKDTTLSIKISSKESNGVNGKTPGSFIINVDENNNSVYTTLNNTIGRTNEDYNVPLIISIDGHTATAINMDSPLRHDAYGGKLLNKGIPYIPLRMASINEVENIVYKYLPGQLTSLRMDNIPGEVGQYNQDLKAYIVEVLNSNTDIDSIYKALRPYIDIKLSKDELIIRTTEEYAKTHKPKYIVVANKDGIINIKKGTQGKFKPVAEQTELDKYLNITMRGIPVTNGKINNGKFTDFKGTSYNTFTEFLIKTGAVVTQYGAVRDESGNLISNASAFANSNTRGQDMRIRVDMKSLSFHSTGSPRNKEMEQQAYTSLAEYAKSIDPDNRYDLLFKLVDTLGVSFNSTEIVDSDVAYAEFNNNAIKLYRKFSTLNNDFSKLTILAHESIHRVINNNLTDDQKKRLSIINQKVKSELKNNNELRISFSPQQLRNLDIMVAQGEAVPEEVITNGLTNLLYAEVLQKIDATTNIAEPKSLAKELLDIILEAISQLVKLDNTALDEVTAILEEVLLNNNGSTATEININRPDDPLGDLDIDISGINPNILGGMNFALVANETISKVPDALSYMRGLDKDSRRIVRDMIKNGNLMFRCK